MRNVPAPESPFWPVLRLLILGIIIVVMLHINYQNGFQSHADIPTLIGILLASAGFDGMKKVFSGNEKK